jgi:hypothetical protein
MIKVIGTSALLLCSAFAPAAGGGGVGGPAGAASGGHPSVAAHRGSSLGNPGQNNAFPDARRRPPCVGAVAGVPTSGAPWPIAPATTSPSLTNGLAVDGTAQSKADLRHLTQQDQGILTAIKQANEKLGEVGNPANRRADRQPSRPANVVGMNDGIQRRDNSRSRPLGLLALGDPLALKETADPRSIQGKPDVNHMSEESQRLAREVIQATDKLGKVGNPAGIPAGPSVFNRSYINGPPNPTSAGGTISRSC